MRTLFAVLIAAALAGPALADPAFWRAEWPRTDFETASVGSWAEIRSGGPGKDGIPALTGPAFIAVADDKALAPREPVIAVVIEGSAPRAYPLRYLTWHEIVNDTVGGVPIAVTFCPLCNAAIVFDRRVGGQTLEFGVTGKLRHSDMIMYDRHSESWWQQATGEAIVGAMTGQVLAQIPVWTQSWAEFRAAHREGQVMDRPDWPRDYGRNPYAGYDSAARPFLYSGDPPPHGIAPLARVVRVGNRAWPLERLAATGRIEEAGVILDWSAGQASALDTADIAAGRDIGSVRVRDADGRPVPHDVIFAFAFHAFHPKGEWMLD